jgi:hypothetical protein
MPQIPRTYTCRQDGRDRQKQMSLITFSRIATAYPAVLTPG